MVADATARIGELGLQVCPVHLGERAAFHRASATGEVASEAEPEGKAAAEIDALWDWMMQQLDGVT